LGVASLWDDLNVRGVFLHGVADAVNAIGVLLAAMAVYTIFQK
jgi:Co/Zn/Cd efflux system component